jgi:hypothetical protein
VKEAAIKSEAADHEGDKPAMAVNDSSGPAEILSAGCKEEEASGKSGKPDLPLKDTDNDNHALEQAANERTLRAGAVKDETAGGEDLAEDFSDFGDSDEDILNQEDEKESRPVSRISGKSSRSAKEEGTETGDTNKREEAQESVSEASKVRIL